MTRQPCQLDETEALRSFVRSMSTARGGHNASTLPIAATVSTPDTTPDATTRPSHERGQAVYTPRSPDNHPAPSPHFAGLKAPQNTPQTTSSSPRLVANRPRGSSDVELPGTAVGEAIFNYIQNIKGVPLSESMWAPPNSPRQHSRLNKTQTASDYLTPVQAVRPNPAINDTFTRMSFQAANTGGKPSSSSVCSSHPFSPTVLPLKDQFASLALGRTIEPMSSTVNHGIGPNAHIEEQLLSNDKSDAPMGTGTESYALPPSQDKADSPAIPTIKNPSADKAEILDKTIDSDIDGRFKLSFLKQQNEKVAASMKSKEQALPTKFLTKWGQSKKSSKGLSLPDYATDESTAPAFTPIPELCGSKDTVATAVAPSLTSKDPASSPASRGAASVAVAVARTAIPGIPKSQDTENLESKLYFQSWPASEKRDKPAAQIRKVILKGLPLNPTPAFVASLVYCGPLEQIHIREDETASVKFLNAADCNKFYEATSNGLVYGKDLQGKEKVVWVSLAKDVDVVGGLLSGWIEADMTRCVRAVPLEEDMGKEYLWKIATRKNRIVEGIEIGKNAGGSRFAIFRFADIAHAVTFRAMLARDEEWEHCNITFAKDPCAEAFGVRIGGKDTAL